MEEKELKTSVKQRILIGAIAVIMIGSIIAGYAGIVLKRSNTNSNGVEIDPGTAAELQQIASDKKKAFSEGTKADFDRFSQYRSEIKAYNEASANAEGLQTVDLEVGTGRELAEGDKDYLAYYVGWCADESVFDSSFDDNNNPTSFAQALDASGSLIEGWEAGVVGMKLGGIREITVPGEFAYKETREICGGTNKPLKFIIMTMPNEDPLKTLYEENFYADYRSQIYQLYGVELTNEQIKDLMDQTASNTEAAQNGTGTETTDSTEATQSDASASGSAESADAQN